MPQVIEEMGLLSDKEWDLLTKEINLFAEEGKEKDSSYFKGEYRKAVREHLARPVPVEFTPQDSMPQGQGEVQTGWQSELYGDPTLNKTFDADIVPGVLKLQIVATGQSGPDWRLTVSVAALAFGFQVGGAGFQLSPVSSYIEIHPSTPLAKADLKFSVSGPKMSFGVTGQACYLGLGWQCTPINSPALFDINP
ncbi:hypothetical protein [Nocardiopsis chromatogenes]|uniref:hypothetical protein n=1 Tax=Nocardiopsis chromatogenes TaxID=280239 RepID=UPI00034C2A86|nr:hypothetical protein [Nocardiopsis chromatogenes]